MRRALRVVFAAVALLAMGCGGGNSTANCDAACTIWKNCGTWTYDACMTDCKAAGDWSDAYLNCLKAASCESLSSCG